MNNKNISKLKKIIPISFIVVFATFLAIPNTGLYRGEKNARLIAQTENRRITPRPTQSLKSKEFYEQFEKWYQDRLRYRDKAIKRWSDFNLNIGVLNHPKIFRGKNNWLFHKDMIITSFNEPEQKINSIKHLQSYCNEKGKNFILFIPPSKETMYREFFPEQIRNTYKKPDSFFIQSEKLLKNNNINYLSITQNLKEEKLKSSHILYIPVDSHWNYHGASFGADKLLQKISNEHKTKFYEGLNLDGTFLETVHPGDYLSMLGFDPNKNKDTIPWSKKYTNEIFFTDCYTGETLQVGGLLSKINYWEKIHNGELILKNNKSTSDIKILVLSDSYTTFMAPYLAQFAKETIITHYNGYAEKKTKTDMKYLLKRYDPDIVVLEIVDRVFYPVSNKDLFGKFTY